MLQHKLGISDEQVVAAWVETLTGNIFVDTIICSGLSQCTLRLYRGGGNV